MLDLDQAIRERHSTRLFLPQPVPRELVNEALALAQYAPSNSNIQPWHMVFASGASRDRLVAALIDEAQRRPPNIPPLPASFQHFRSELGAQVYGAMGISREDTARHAAAVLRNWEFLHFRASVLFRENSEFISSVFIIPERHSSEYGIPHRRMTSVWNYEPASGA